MAHRTIQAGGGKVEEAIANAIFSPGMLVEIISTGKIQKHSTGGGSAERAWALESAEQGKVVTDAYAADDIAKYAVFAPGDKVIALLADGETAVIGSKLESNGDGYLRVVIVDSSALTVEVGSIVGVAMEAVDMSDTSAADPNQLMLVRVW